MEHGRHLKNANGVHVGINVGTNGEVEYSNDAMGDAVIGFFERNPKASARIAAMSLGISARQVERRIAKLRQEGRLRREGSNKAGVWVVCRKD